ncbi:MAG: hypothetical protein EA402_02035 [Planctomycetota bacterium]|nr:MAG: hypothetical protein EA402_02035 [Planctomycetota bacterium]
MAIGLRRKVRLDSRRERQGINRQKNSSDKRPERIRRDARLAAKLAQQLPNLDSVGLSPDVASWASVQLGRRASKLTGEDLKTLIG